jgi:formylglycine-generating enzyme required for sulfatase activity
VKVVRRPGVFVLSIGVATSIAACSLLTSFDGLTTGVTDADGGRELPSAEASPGVDGGRADDSAVSADACPSGKGPAQLLIDSALGAYCIDSTEVTRAQYDVFLRASPANTHPRCGWNTTFVPSRDWPYGGTTKDHPVVGVDWCDAYAYCAWAGKQLCGAIAGGRVAQGAVADPKQSAFVHACSRAGTLAFPYGPTFDGGACNGAAYGAGGTIPVATAATCEGGYPGLFDLVGNASEWADACDDVEPEGGAATGADDDCRSFNSGYNEPEETDLRCRSIRAQGRSYTGAMSGFRCCAKP